MSNHTRSSGRQRGSAAPAEQGFICANCRGYVTCEQTVAGVRNRNHCPYCLWSRHLDWREAGDRLAGCRAPMRPIGLTIKRGRNKYARDCGGELMLIHRCSACDHLSINRIAADDLVSAIFALFEASCAPAADLRAALAQSGVAPLTDGDRELVRRRLLGGQGRLSAYHLAEQR